MKKTLGILFLLVLASCHGGYELPEGYDCFSVIAGKDATVDGCVYLAHNEDDGGEQMLNIYNLPATSDHLGALWFEFPGLSNADAYMNDHGVCVVTDKCSSREDKANAGTVQYEVRTEAGRHATTAREGVKLIGRMIEEYGYRDTGRSYMVVDQHEGWVCSVVRGHHWVAQRVPDDAVMTIPNYYVIGKVDLSDTVNFLGSADVVSYAQERGWYDPERDGEFSFREAYSDSVTLVSRHNVERQQMAQEYIFGDVLPGGEVPFCRVPAKKISRKTLSKLLTTAPVRAKSTVLSAVFVLDPSKPDGQGCCVWCGYPGQKASRHEKWTLGRMSPSDHHRFTDPDEALEKHFTDTAAFRTRYPDHFYWKYSHK